MTTRAQILKSSNPQILKNSVKTFARLSSLIAILVFQFISTQAQAACNDTSSGNWSGAIWLTGAGNCSASPPGATDNVTIFNNVTLDQNVAVNEITLALGTLNASNFTLTLTATETIMLAGGTFNADTSTVKLSDADHSFSVSNLTFYNLQWATPLTAPRTLAINGNTLMITRAAGGTFNLDGTPTNPVTFAGTGNFGSMVTVNNCAGKPATMTNVTCIAPITNNPVSAQIFLLKDKPAIFSEEVK